MAGVRAAKKLFAKAIPGAAIVLGTWANSSATQDLARRARAMFTWLAANGYGSGQAPPALPEPRRPEG
jgi:hypothetical protein